MSAERLDKQCQRGAHGPLGLHTGTVPLPAPPVFACEHRASPPTFVCEIYFHTLVSIVMIPGRSRVKLGKQLHGDDEAAADAVSRAAAEAPGLEGSLLL